jgi:hypothetical protein
MSFWIWVWALIRARMMGLTRSLFRGLM